MHDLPSASPRTTAIKSPFGWHSIKIEVSLGGEEEVEGERVEG